MAGIEKTNDDESKYVSSAARLDNVGQVGTEAEVQKIVSAGPWGALTVAGIAVFILLAIWFAFFILVFLPRGPIG